MSVRETADIETSSESYARRFSGAVGAWFLKVQEEATLRMLSDCPGAAVLDVGGGHGQIAGALARNGYRVTVLGSAEVCKARIQRLLDRGACSFSVGDVLQPPFQEQAFDVVVSYRFLPHVADWTSFLHQLARLARHSVIVDYPSKSSFNYFVPHLYQYKKQVEGNTRAFTTFYDAEIENVLRECGFACEVKYREFALPMVIHRIMKSPIVSMSIEAALRRLSITDAVGSPVILRAVRKSHESHERLAARPTTVLSGTWNSHRRR